MALPDFIPQRFARLLDGTTAAIVIAIRKPLAAAPRISRHRDSPSPSGLGYKET
jgi:hypothetical protein